MLIRPLFTMLTLSTALLFMPACSSKEDADKKDPAAAKKDAAENQKKLAEAFVKEYGKKKIPVAAAPVDEQRVVKTFTSTTFLEPMRQVSLEVPRQGVVAKVYKLAGQEVKAGETIATLTSHELMSEYRKRSIQLANTRRPYVADQKLYQQKLISKDQWEKSRSAFRTAQVEFSRAKKNLDQLKIVAPFTGTVAKNALQNHQPMDQADKNPIEMVDTAKLKGAIHVPVFYRAAIKVGHALQVSSRNQKATATIERIAPLVDRSSGTVAMHFVVDNSQQAFFAGESVRVILPLDQGTDRLVLPENSVVFEGSVAYVYTVRPSEQKEITKELKAFVKRKQRGDSAGMKRGGGKGRGGRGRGGRGRGGGPKLSTEPSDQAKTAKGDKTGAKKDELKVPDLNPEQLAQLIKVDRAKKIAVQVEQIPSGRYAIAGKTTKVRKGQNIVIIGLTQIDDGRKIEVVP